MGSEADVEIFVVTGSGSSEALEQAQLALADELRALPGLRIELISAGVAPHGSKAVDVGTASLLLPAVVPAVDLLKTAIGTLREWLSRQPPTTTLKVKIGDDLVEWSGSGAIPEAVTRFLDAAARRYAP